MWRAIILSSVVLVFLLPSSSESKGISGHYIEARTCQVYTGPCFAAGEVGLTGKDAIMAWSIQDGNHHGVNLAGLKVIMVVRAGDTLGFQGFEGVKKVKSVLFVDEKASRRQREALIQFAKKHSGKAGKAVVRVTSLPIEMKLDMAELTGKVKAGKQVRLVTRKARLDDCICSNESAYYPPLAKTRSLVPGVTIDGGFSGRGLGSRWSIPDTRSAYMATFAYEGDRQEKFPQKQSP